MSTRRVLKGGRGVCSPVLEVLNSDPKRGMKDKIERSKLNYEEEID